MPFSYDNPLSDSTAIPTHLNGERSTIFAQIIAANLVIQKSVDKVVSYIGDTITYNISVKNTGTVPADNVVITDPIPVGTELVPGSMTVSVPFVPILGGAIKLTNPVAPNEIVTISFKVLVVAIPNPNPIVNKATGDYTYTVDPQNPDGVSASTQSNAAITTVFRNNFSQQISDLIESIALEQAALAAIMDAEGAKIQRIVAMTDVTPQQLLCLNRSIAETAESIVSLEAILKQKISIVECQINGEVC